MDAQAFFQAAHATITPAMKNPGPCEKPEWFIFDR